VIRPDPEAGRGEPARREGRPLAIEELERVATPLGGSTSGPVHPIGGGALVDLRAPASFRRSHLRGSVSIPASRLSGSLFLLPPRRRHLILIDRSGERAAEAAAYLLARGWRGVSYLEGSPLDADAACRESGPAPNRIWEPASFLREIEAELPRKGPACDLACGSGRNTVYLALGGREATGIDVLPDALAQARRLARAARIPPPGRARFVRLDLADPTSANRLLRPGRFAVITCTRYLDRALFPAIRRSLAPGGCLVYETFLEEHKRRHGKPASPSHLLRPGELRGWFADLEILRYREGPDEDDCYLASLLARRPAMRDCR
jgi:tellurite methyltransferase